MSDFKWRHFQGEIILWAVRWYCRYGISYRDLEQMIGEHSVPVDHSTIYRWVQKYAPEIQKRLRWHRRRPLSTSCRVDETYMKVAANGQTCIGLLNRAELQRTASGMLFVDRSKLPVDTVWNPYHVEQD